jgi:tetratricopeptide (TPR) repeat protein
MPDKIVTAVANYLNLPTAPTSNLQNIALAEQALRVNPNNFYAHLLLGGIYSRGMLGEHKMDIDLAIHHLEEAGKVEEYYRSEPGFAASSVVQHSYLGYQYIKKFVTNTHPHSAENFLDQYVVRALEELHKAVAIDNTHVGSHLLLALTYMDIRDYDKAIISCKNVLALDPYNSAIYQKLGAVYREQGQLDEALEIYKQAVFYNASDAMLDKDMETAELAINIKGHFLELAGQMDNLLAALISNSYD